MSPIRAMVASLLTILMLAALARAEPPRPKKIPILLDTDIGGFIDDPFALALALASPELDLRGVTTVGANAESRALIVCRFLSAVGRHDVPVAWGRPPQPAADLDGEIQYARHPAVIFNRTLKPAKESAVDFLYSQLKARPGELTLVAIGPLTNIARLLAEHPDCKPWIKELVILGGSLKTGYDGKPPTVAEWNIKQDIKAAQAVFTSGVSLIVAPLDATATLSLDDALRRRLFGACSPLSLQLQALEQLWDAPKEQKGIPLFDAFAVALSFTERFATMEDLQLTVDDQGFTRAGKGKANARVAVSLKGAEFPKWLTERLAGHGEAVLPKPPGNRSKLIERGGLPNRVHVIEDYETDIEKRWWMSGKVETANVPPGSTRACRGVLTMDFDGQMGDTKTMYTAVIFNPVPGPPMGKNPRLSFRYWLKGTDTLRVQIYSLSNGYHRYLSLTGLPQGRWESAAVDMTAVRRPDGSGGPLSENERIDDIQFYADPRAELFIDDIVLYDAAPAEEKRPFPARLLFTGWFDTGKQGKEWPGTFDVLPKKGYFWNAAKSAENADLQAPWLRLHLRGERPVGETTQLVFRYHLTGADTLRVLLLNRTTKETHTVELKGLKSGQWAEATADFSAGSSKPRKGDRVDEVHFILPKGAELLLDDVLLHEPGR